MVAMLYVTWSSIIIYISDIWSSIIIYIRDI